jgi:hypothetical protein
MPIKRPVGRSFRLAVTADLHHDVARSKAPAEALAATWPDVEADALLLCGDTATSDRRHLETALDLFADDGRPRLFVPGNHEFWSRITPTDVQTLLLSELPRRVRAAGWHWLPTSPFRQGDVAIVGNSGWYDYAFADQWLGLPRRFYRSKMSPAVAASLDGDSLSPGGDDVPARARTFRARWNDSRFIQGITDDAMFCDARLRQFDLDLTNVADAKAVVAAVHVCPSQDLLPRRPEGDLPEAALKYAFARAYLGSPRFGETARRFGNVRHVVCGHSHVARHVERDGITWTNVGSDYVKKQFVVLDV